MTATTCDLTVLVAGIEHHTAVDWPLPQRTGFDGGSRWLSAWAWRTRWRVRPNAGQGEPRQWRPLT